MADTSLGYWVVPIAMLGGAVRVSTPFLFVSLGECITERSGRINLGLEGILVMGAMTGYAVSYATGNPWLGVLAAAGAGAAVDPVRRVEQLAADRGRAPGEPAVSARHRARGRARVGVPHHALGPR